MRKALPWFLSTACLAGLYFILQSEFPKYAGFLPFFLALILLDAYLWSSLRGKVSLKESNISRTRLRINYLLAAFYWLPLMLLASSVLSGFLVSFTQWNISWRTYLLGFVFIIYISRIVAILFLAFADTLRLFRHFRIFHKQDGKKLSFRNIPRNMKIVITGWILSGVAFVIFLCGMIFWNYDFRVREEVILLPELPASFNGTRIVHISDIHLGSWTCKNKLEEAVGIINGLRPDMVFFTGDLVNYTSYEAYEFADILKEIRAPMGIFAILGNHDYGDYVSWKSVRAKLENREYLEEIYKYMGWNLLLNEHVIIRRGPDSIAVIGVENWGGTHRFPRLGDIAKATAGIEDMGVQLLMTHDPSHWEKLVIEKYRNIDISFSGHTHGFQMGIECCGFRWSPSEYMYDTWAGLYRKEVPGAHPQYLYVNRGLGSIGYPGRIGILPEITLITLRNKQ